MTMSLVTMSTITIIKHELEHQLIDSTENNVEKKEKFGGNSVGEVRRFYSFPH